MPPHPIDSQHTHRSPLLDPVNLHVASDFDELLKQRIACGWNCERETIHSWRELIDQGHMSIFWIMGASAPVTLSKSSESVESVRRDAEKSQQEQLTRIGHISMQSVLDPPEPDLARSDKTLLMLSTFFIYPEHRSKGVGRLAIKAIESYALTSPYGSPSCRAITLTTVSRRYTEDDGEEWRGLYPRRGMKAPKRGSSLEDWYGRQGYVKFKDAPRYPEKLLDGTDIKLVAVFMRKDL